MALKGLRGVLAWIFPKLKSPRQYLVIEVEKGLPYKAADDAAIATLKDHPGFVAIVNRMKLKKAYLASQLNGQRQESIRDVDFLQHGIYWLGYLESEVNSATNNLKARTAATPASDSVAEEFERVRLAIEGIGSQDLE